jgi:hypothetical protein
MDVKVLISEIAHVSFLGNFIYNDKKITAVIITPDNYFHARATFNCQFGSSQIKIYPNPGTNFL